MTAASPAMHFFTYIIISDIIVLVYIFRKIIRKFVDKTKMV